MEFIYPTRDEIIHFFNNRYGYFSVLDISTAIVVPRVQRSNPMDKEWKHVRTLLHELKSEGFLLVENEGGDIYEEKFSSTPDRIKKYQEISTKTKNFYSNRNSNKVGTVSFDHSNNNGTYIIGEDDYTFGIKFSGASQKSIFVYNDHKTVDSIALIEGAKDFDQVNFDMKYDGTSSSRCPEIGQIVLIKNKQHRCALIKIEGIKMKSRGDVHDEVSFSYKIFEGEFHDLIAGEEAYSVGDHMGEIKKGMLELLNDPQYTMRKFSIFKKRFHGLSEDELRRTLLSLGAMTFSGQNNEELWGLRSRNQPNSILESRDVAIDKTEEIFKINPEIYGIGVNVKALVRYLRNRFKSEKESTVKRNASHLSTQEENNSWKKPEIILSVIMILIALVSVPWWPSWYTTVQRPVQAILSEESVATTTPNLIDIYKRAFSYDILADRQAFFRKYVGLNIYGDGKVEEISSLGDRYVLEIKINDYSILCPQEKTENFETSYPLLKGKSVRFFGVFTYSNIFGYDENKLVIDQCGFERK